MHFSNQRCPTAYDAHALKSSNPGTVKTLRKKVLITFGVFLLLSLTLALASYFSEPRHKGRRLSEWLELYDRNARINGEAEQAILAIGSNAVPTLVKMLIPGEKLSLGHLLERTGIPIELIQDTSDRMRNHNLAMHGFRILGSTASNALPQLLFLLEQEDHSYLVSDAIQAIGQPALAPALPLLDSTNQIARRHAVHIILHITDRNLDTVSNLLAHPDPFVRGETYLWLPSHSLPLQQIMEIQLDGLLDPETYVACRAALALRNLNLYATNALPRLHELSFTTNARLAGEIQSTIRNIEKRLRIEESSSRSGPRPAKTSTQNSFDAN